LATYLQKVALLNTCCAQVVGTSEGIGRSSVDAKSLVPSHDQFLREGWLISNPSGGTNAYEVSDTGTRTLGRLGIDIAEIRGLRRSFAYACLDWSRASTAHRRRLGSRTPEACCGEEVGRSRAERPYSLSHQIGREGHPYPLGSQALSKRARRQRREDR
jgi:hypothetical protein